MDFNLSFRVDHRVHVDGLDDLAEAGFDLARQVKALVAVLTKSEVVGIVANPGVPSQRPHSEEYVMPKCTVSMVKKPSAKKMGAAPGAKAAGSSFVLIDNQDDSVTVTGVDAAGNPVDITTVATLIATSSDPASLSVDPPSGMSFTVHGLKPTPPGSPVTVTVTATWNDGSMGPFSFTLPCDLTGSAATGITATFGTPTVRP